MALCAMHIVDNKEKITAFTKVSWEKFVSCAKEWSRLSGKAKEVADEALFR